MMGSKIKAQIVKLTPRPGDVLVLRQVRQAIMPSDEETDAMLSRIAAHTGCMTIALPPGDSLTNYSREEFAALLRPTEDA